MSNAIVKNLSFGDEAKNNVFKGIDKLTKAVSSTLGASGKCVMLENEFGKPVITKDGVTVANSITLRYPIENMGYPIQIFKGKLTLIDLSISKNITYYLFYNCLDSRRSRFLDSSCRCFNSITEHNKSGFLRLRFRAGIAKILFID